MGDAGRKTPPMRWGIGWPTRIWRDADVWLISLAALLTLAMAGFRNTLIRDAGGYLYIGQQVLRGVPPYASLFTHKGPLAPLLVALGVALSEPLGLADILVVRALFGAIGAATVAALYALVKDWTGSRPAGLVGALVVLGCYPVTFGATAGPEPKLPMLLCVALSLYLTSRRRWLWAGLCGSLAALTWQPTAIYPAITLLLAALAGGVGRARWRAVGATLAGGALPAALIVGYYLERGAFDLLLRNYVMFNVTQLDRGTLTLLDHLRAPLEATILNYRTALIPIVVGMIGMVVLYTQRIQSYRSWGDVWEDRYAPALLSFPLPMLWSLKDYQGAPDFYVFLPYVALGCGLLVEQGLRNAGGRERARRLAGAALLGLCLALWGAAVLNNRAQRDWELDRYQRMAQQLTDRFGPDVRVLARGRPYVLALMHKTSPTPHMNANYVFDLDMERFPGGYAEWLRQIEAYDPQIIAQGRATGRYAEDFKAWLNARYVAQGYAPWNIYVKRELLRPDELLSATPNTGQSDDKEGASQ